MSIRASSETIPSTKETPAPKAGSKPLHSSAGDKTINLLGVALIAAVAIGIAAGLSVGFAYHNIQLGVIVGASTASILSVVAYGIHRYCLYQLSKSISHYSHQSDAAFRNIGSGKEKLISDLTQKYPAYLVRRMDKAIESLAVELQRKQLEIDILPAMDYLVGLGIIHRQDVRCSSELIHNTSNMTAILILHLQGKKYGYPKDFLNALAKDDDVAPPEKLPDISFTRLGYFATHIKAYVYKLAYAMDPRVKSYAMVYSERWVCTNGTELAPLLKLLKHM